jgi:hypothetical protein
MQDIGSKKWSLLKKTILAKWRRPMTSPPPTTLTTTTMRVHLTTTTMRVHLTTTQTTTPARRMTRNPTKARSSKTLESNSKPPDPLQRTTCPESWTQVAS